MFCYTMPKIMLSHYGVMVVTHQADSQPVVNVGIVFAVCSTCRLQSASHQWEMCIIILASGLLVREITLICCSVQQTSQWTRIKAKAMKVSKEVKMTQSEGCYNFTSPYLRIPICKYFYNMSYLHEVKKVNGMIDIQKGSW